MLFNYIQFHVRMSQNSSTYYVKCKRRYQLDSAMLKLSQEFM